MSKHPYAAEWQEALTAACVAPGDCARRHAVSAYLPGCRPTSEAIGSFFL